MSTGKPSAPQTPNSGLINAAQNYGDVQTAVANTYMGNANVNTPTGSVAYSQGPATQVQIPLLDNNGSFLGFQTVNVPSFNRTESLAPAQQAMLNQQNQLGQNLNAIALDQSSRIGAQLSNPLDPNALPPRMYGPLADNIAPNYIQAPSAVQGQNISAPSLQQYINATGSNASQIMPFANSSSNAIINLANASQAAPTAAGSIQRSIGPTDYSADRTAVENALMSRINPQIDRDRSNLETQLVNQGLVRGTTAFNNAMDEVNRQANDARQQAVLAGGQEQSRLANLAQQAGTFANTAQNQAYGQNIQSLAQAAQLQGLNFNQVMAALSQNSNLQNQMAQMTGQDFSQQAAAANQNFNQQLASAGQDFSQQAAAANQNFAQRQASSAQNFGQQQTTAQFENENRNQNLQEALALRNQPVNEISALMAGGQVNVPQFQPFSAGQIANTNLGQNIYNSAALGQQNYQTQQSGVNALIGALGGLGGAGLYGLGKKYG